MTDSKVTVIDLTASDGEEHEQLTLALSHSEKTSSISNFENLNSKKQRKKIDKQTQQAEKRFY